MNLSLMDPKMIALVAVVIVIIAVLAWLYVRKRRSTTAHNVTSGTSRHSRRHFLAEKT
jgi:hypothetical protein